VPGDTSLVDGTAALNHGREACAAERWRDAYDLLAAVDRHIPLRALDLELLARAAYMLGRESEYLGLLERAHRAHAKENRPLAAVRCAFWIGVNLARRGDMARASGWIGRAERELDSCGGDPVERGYLLLPRVFEQEEEGELETAAATAAEASAIGLEHGDADLLALAGHERGHLLIKLGRPKDGLRLLDQAMLAVTAGELSPIVSGIVYCGVIVACQDAADIRRAQEWTAALSGWCERQPDLVAFTGRCLTHRAELSQLRGALEEALDEAQRAEERCARAESPAAAAEATYRRAEIHRLVGEHGRAEDAYRQASRGGRDPQPGLALLRLAQGRVDTAAAAISTAVADASGPARRTALLPAYVEIMLAAGDAPEARAGAHELDTLAAGREDSSLDAAAAAARGAVALASGDPRAALSPLRRAAGLWRVLGAVHETARARELLGLACRALGDEETAALELAAAREAYTELGARTDLARLGERADVHGLTGRELEVLRLVARGATNKAIAAELVLSERTVDRHVSNILAKLSVSSRAAATARAYEHGLLRTG
jgi:ATP/maltotriose-dependent transcriptional regulator MalT